MPIIDYMRAQGGYLHHHWDWDWQYAFGEQRQPLLVQRPIKISIFKSPPYYNRLILN
jgi:hypothetical protein